MIFVSRQNFIRVFASASHCCTVSQPSSLLFISSSKVFHRRFQILNFTLPYFRNKKGTCAEATNFATARRGTITVRKSAMYLLSDLASGVTGEVHYVDCGYNIMGMGDVATDAEGKTILAWDAAKAE